MSCSANPNNDSFTGQRGAHPHSVRVLFLLCDVLAVPSLRCVWCQATVHDDCMDSLSDADQCDLGEFHSLIIPPHYLHKVNKLRRRHPDEYSKVPGI